MVTLRVSEPKASGPKARSDRDARAPPATPAETAADDPTVLPNNPIVVPDTTNSDQESGRQQPATPVVTTGEQTHRVTSQIRLGIEEQIKTAQFSTMGQGPVTAEDTEERQLSDDRTAQILERSRIGTALFYVPTLNPVWKVGKPRIPVPTFPYRPQLLMLTWPPERPDPKSLYQ